MSLYIEVQSLEGSMNLCNRNREIPKRDFPITTGVWAIGALVEDRCQEGQSSLESMPGGIINRRIGNPKGVSSTHFKSAKCETLIGGRTVVLWTSRSHVKELV